LSWRAKRSVGAPLGLLLIALVLILDVWLLRGLLDEGLRLQQIHVGLFLRGVVILLSIPALLFLLYHVLSCLTLRYHLDRNGLSISWLGSRQVVPIRDVQQIIPARDLEGVVLNRQGVRWPGHERGEGLVPGIGPTRFLATRPLGDQLLVLTPDLALAISPHDTDAFLRAFETRQKLGPNRILEAQLQQSAWLTWALWTDQVAGAILGAALVANLGLFFYLMVRFPGLDEQLPLHFNMQGVADRIGAKTELLALPVIGLLILGANLVLGLALYRWERAGSYLLWGAAVAVQLLFWLATASIIA
jgi:hypothetical protein